MWHAANLSEDTLSVYRMTPEMYTVFPGWGLDGVTHGQGVVCHVTSQTLWDSAIQKPSSEHMNRPTGSTEDGRGSTQVIPFTCLTLQTALCSNSASLCDPNRDWEKCPPQHSRELRGQSEQHHVFKSSMSGRVHESQSPVKECDMSCIHSPGAVKILKTCMYVFEKGRYQNVKGAWHLKSGHEKDSMHLYVSTLHKVCYLTQTIFSNYFFNN